VKLAQADAQGLVVQAVAPRAIGLCGASPSPSLDLGDGSATPAARQLMRSTFGTAPSIAAQAAQKPKLTSATTASA